MTVNQLKALQLVINGHYVAILWARRAIKAHVTSQKMKIGFEALRRAEAIASEVVTIVGEQIVDAAGTPHMTEGEDRNPGYTATQTLDAAKTQYGTAISAIQNATYDSHPILDSIGILIGIDQIVANQFLK